MSILKAMATKRIAVLMTCFNRVNTTLACLNRLFSQMLPEEFSLDVWLVDDASPDQTGEKVKAAFPWVHVIRGTGNLFWCKGMRLAWDKAARYCPYDYFLWLNDDVLLKPDALSCLIADSLRQNAVVVGSFSSDETETVVSYCATTADGRREMPDGDVPRLADGYMNGNLVLIPKGVFDVIGPIHGGYTHGYGDYDYGLRIKEHGLHFYSSSHFCGVCPQQPERYLHVKDLSFAQRVRSLFDPRGYSLTDTFRYRYRHWGLMRALVSCVHVMVTVLTGTAKN